MGLKVTVPTSLSEITFNQHQHFIASIKDHADDVEFVKLAAVMHFTDLTAAHIKAMPVKDFNSIAETLLEMLNTEPRHVERFKLEGIEYGFIPNLDQLTAGEYIDIDRLFTEDIHATMAILYRPITESSFGMYRIEPYESPDKHKKQLMNMPAEAALGAQVFFWRLSSGLLKATQAYLLRPEVVTALRAVDSQSVGAGILQSIRSLKDAESRLRMFLPSTYTPSFTTSNTVSKKRRSRQGN